MRPAMNASEDDGVSQRHTREGRVFVFLTVVLAPLLAVAVVGLYGFVIWVYQVFAGPPAS